MPGVELLVNLACEERRAGGRAGGQEQGESRVAGRHSGPGGWPSLARCPDEVESEDDGTRIFFLRKGSYDVTL